MPTTPLLSDPDLARIGDQLRASPFLCTRFALESSVIASFINTRALPTYIDVGCWYGYLLRQVLDRCTVRRAVGVDAVPAFIDYAARTIARPGVEFINAIVLPESRRARPVCLRVHSHDTSKSGLDVAPDAGVEVRGVPAATIADLLTRIGPNAVQHAYLKIDAEGCDEHLVMDLLTAGFRPAVIHFEILKNHGDGEAALALLERCGYRRPALPGDHPYYSVACAADHTVTIGFRPDTVYREIQSSPQQGDRL